jgi:hypothetical protein
VTLVRPGVGPPGIGPRGSRQPCLIAKIWIRPGTDLRCGLRDEGDSSRLLGERRGGGVKAVSAPRIRFRTLFSIQGAPDRAASDVAAIVRRCLRSGSAVAVDADTSMPAEAGMTRQTLTPTRSSTTGHRGTDAANTAGLANGVASTTTPSSSGLSRPWSRRSGSSNRDSAWSMAGRTGTCSNTSRQSAQNSRSVRHRV